MKILYVTTVSNTINAFLLPQIRLLVELGHHVDVAFSIVQPVSDELQLLGCQIIRVPFQRMPLHRGNIIAVNMLRELIQINSYDIVHTHTPVASACTRIACRKNLKTIVIYTAHGFHFYKGAPLLNWLIFYPIEKWLSQYTDILFTINHEDYERARSKLHAKKTAYLPGIGFQYEKFANVQIDRQKKRDSIGVPQNAFVLLTVGELNKNKNQSTIIRAIARLKNPNIFYVICGVGKMEDNLHKLVKSEGIEKNVIFLGFRQDINEICKCCDVFAFPSYREGLGIAALEAMAVGLPIMTSNIHGIVDYSDNNQTGFSCAPNDIAAFSKAIQILHSDRMSCKKMGDYNREFVKKYDCEHSLFSFIESIKEIAL